MIRSTDALDHPSSKAPAVPLYSVTYQGIRIGSVAREPRRTHWVALSIIDNQAAKFATRNDASEWLKRRWIEERERAGSETR